MNNSADKPLTPKAGRPVGRSLGALEPMLIVGTFLVVVAMLMAWLDWHRDQMLVIAAGLGAAITISAVILLYRQGHQRRVTDTALQNVEARVGGIVESAMDAIVTADESQRIVLFNAAAEKVFRWPRAAVLGQPLEMLIPQRLRHVHREHIERFETTGVTSRRMGDKTVLVGLRANGEEFPIEASISQHSEDGHKLFTVILRDVTESSQAEKKLLRSEARLRAILDSAMDAIITVDQSQHIVLFNAAAETVFGCSRDEAIGAPLTWFIPERYRSTHSEHVRRFGEAGTTSRRMGAQRIVTGLRRNGEEFPIEASISHTTEHGNKFFTVILRDVTARVQAEQALRASKEELRGLAAAAHTVREQEKSRIARELHDELAQSLTSLKMDLASVREELPPQQESLSAKLETMQTMLDAMVTATRRIAADLRPLMLDDLGLVPASEWLAQNFTQRTGIRCEFSVDPPELQLQDPHATAIFRILQESLTNVGRHAQASLVEVTLDGNDGEIVLRVRDNGQGFNPDSARKPASFGLAGLRERASLLGGEISIDAAPGRGTVVEVHIPLQTPASSL